MREKARAGRECVLIRNDIPKQGLRASPGDSLKGLNNTSSSSSSSRHRNTMRKSVAIDDLARTEECHARFLGEGVTISWGGGIHVFLRGVFEGAHATWMLCPLILVPGCLRSRQT